MRYAPLYLWLPLVATGLFFLLGTSKGSRFFQKLALSWFSLTFKILLVRLIRVKKEVQVFTLLPFVRSPRPFWALGFPSQGVVVLLNYL